MAALGFTVKPTVYLHPDNPTQAAHKTVTWMASPASADNRHAALPLIGAWMDRSLLKTHPDHPLLAGLMALQTRKVLADWQRGIHGKPHVVILPGHKLARAIPPTARSQAADISTHLAPDTDGLELDHAAAAITAGHGVAAFNGRRCFVTARGAFSAITAGRLSAAAAVIAADARKSATTAFHGFDPGEHPFLYGIAAIAWGRYLADLAAKKDPTVHLNSRTSSRVALVSQSILESTHSFKEHIYHHTK